MVNLRSYLILFLIQPLFALVLAFKNRKYDLFRMLLWLFAGYYGFTIAIGPESRGSDIVRYIGEFQTLHGESFSSFADYWTYYKDSGEIDVVRSFLAILISRFSDSQSLLLLIYGLIYGFFYSGNAVMVFRRINLKDNYIKLLYFCFLLLLPLWDMGGFRFNTAVHIFVYGILSYILENKSKNLWWCYLTPVLHFSFLIPVALLLVYFVIRNFRLGIFFYLFTVSLLAPGIETTKLNQVFKSYSNEQFQERTGGYIAEDNITTYRQNRGVFFSESRRWYAILYTDALRWTIYGYLFFLFFRKEGLSFTDIEINLFKIILFFFVFSNLVDDIPSFGRFFFIGELLALPFILFLLSRKKVFGNYKIISLPLVLLFFIVSVRSGLLLTSVEGVISNPFLSLFAKGDFTSLNQLMRAITG